MERKLAAILAADVAGYSRLMGGDEKGTLDALRAHREVVDGLISTHRGRVFGSAGDSVVAEFPSAVEALNCAVEIQQTMEARNEAEPKVKRIEFRIGLNIGDVMAETGNMFGDGINIADRVQKIAAPGGVCVSRNVYNQVKNKVSVRFEPMGAHRAKNIAEPLVVYRVLLQGVASTPRAFRWLRTARLRSPAAAALGLVVLLLVGLGAAWQFYPQHGAAPVSMPAIAVLPFDNLSGDSNLEYFSDGVSEDIIAMLSRFPDLAVMARNSSFTYKGHAVDVRQVGRELDVDYVLEGSVRRDAAKVRIVAQLVDARTGEHVWAERYDKEGSDPWALQDEVTRKIIGSLTGEQGRVKQAEYRRLWGKDSANLEEYDYYLRGHALFFGDKDELGRAGAIWSEGLRRFPDSSLLRVKPGFYHLRQIWINASEDYAADYRRANELAREARSGENLSPQVRRLSHWLNAWLRHSEGNFERALAEADAAIALAPYDAFMVGDLAGILAMAGKHKDAIALLEELQRREPQWINIWPLTVAYYVAGDYERAIEAAGKLRPDRVDRYVLLAGSYVRLNRLEDARAEVKKLHELAPRYSQANVRDEYIYSDPAIIKRQVADLAAAGLPEH